MSSRIFIAIVFSTLAVLTGIAHMLKPRHLKSDKKPLVWVTDPNPQRDPQVDSFNELHPEYKLRIDPDNSGVMKILVQCSAAMGPDLIDHVNDFTYQTYCDAGILMDVTEEAKKMGFGLDTLHPAVRPLVTMPTLMKDGTIQERQYVYPCNVYHTYIIYNKNLFDKYKIPYPSSDMTWEEYIEIGKKLTKFDTPNSAIPTVFGAAGADYLTCIWGKGGDILNPDGTRCTLASKETIDGLVFWHQLFYKHGIEPTASQKRGVQTQGGWAGGFRNWFGEGKVGMLWGARWMLIQFRRFIKEQQMIRENWLKENPNADPKDAPEVIRFGACLVPRFKDAKRYTRYGSRGTGINAESKNRKDALKFMQYLAGKEYSMHINRGADSKPGNMLYNKLELFENKDWPGEQDVHKVSIDAIPGGRMVPRSIFIPYFTVDSNVKDVRELIMTEPNLTREEIAKLAKDLAHRIDLKIAQNIKRNPNLKKAYESLLKKGAEPIAIDLKEVE